MDIFIMSLLPYYLFLILKVRYGLYMLQQNSYNTENRYLKWTIKNYKKVFLNIELLSFIVLLAIKFLDSFYYSLIVIIFYIVMAYYEIYKLSHEQSKKKFNVTSRVKRLITTILLIFLILNVCIFYKYDTSNNFVYYLVLILFGYFSYYVVLISNIINIPVEKLVYKHYYNKAKNKLKDMKNLSVVGITGSYGKTSSKNIVNSILSADYITYPTPKSFNTPYGVMISINNGIDKFTNMFIAEMGAYKKGEIKELCDFVNPKYGILTTIGVAHLETFKSEQNIIDGKFELIESLPSDGVAILNKDDIKQATHKINNNCKVLWIGIDNKDADVVASNIKLSSTGTTFDVKFKDLENKYTFTTSLLGKYNIYNILDGLALGHYLNISIDKMIQKVRTLKPIEHRLELRKYYNITLIDDAFNSNPVGSSMALDVLSLMPGKKIIVTPGMIELGEKEYEYNYNFGKKISEVCDEVILVGENQTKPIKKALDDNKFTKVHIINDVKEAFTLMNKLKDKNTYVLLENDLPDIFNEK